MVNRLLDFWVAGDDSHFDPLFDYSPLMIHSIDATGTLVRVSTTWAAFLGYDPEEMVGRKSVELLTPTSCEKAKTEVLPAFMETGICKDIEYEFVHKDGSIRDVSMSAVAKRDETGAFVHSFAVMFDISDRKLAERQLKAALRDAEEANAAKNRFLSALSHELRTPMNAIVGFGNLLKRTELTAKQAEQLDHVCQSADLMVSMLDDLLNLGQMETGKFSVKAVPFDLHQLLDEISENWGSQLREAGLRFFVNREYDLPHTVIGDPIRIRQIVSNYLANAMKFTEEGSVTLSVTGDARPDRSTAITFSVRDTGAGIAEEDLEQVFERFERGNSSDVSPTVGWGLGLAICKELAALMGGAVSVRSRLGEGSEFTFRVTLPITDAHPDTPRDTDLPEEEITPFSQAPVLIAEDNKANQEILRAMLETMGLSCVVVSNGVQALEAVKSGKFSMIFMDAQMPVMDGLTSTRNIRKIEGVGARLPIVFVTANARKTDQKRFLDAGGDDVVTKPYSRRDLQNAILRAKLSQSGGGPGGPTIN